MAPHSAVMAYVMGERCESKEVPEITECRSLI